MKNIMRCSELFLNEPTKLLKNILVISANGLKRSVLLNKTLKSNGCHIENIKSCKDAIYHLETTRDVNLVLYDPKTQDLDCVEFLKIIRSINPELEVILIDSASNYDSNLGGSISNAIHFLEPPFNDSKLEELLFKIDKLENQKEVSIESEPLVNHLTIDFSVRSRNFHLDTINLKLEDLLRKYTKMNYLEIQNVLLAFQETVQNAHEHGNLALQSEWKEEFIVKDNCTMFEKAMQERLNDALYADRQINIQVTIDQSFVQFSVEDEGSGVASFDTDDEKVGAIHGLGLKMIKNLMDEVRFNQRGNRVTIRKYFYT